MASVKNYTSSKSPEESASKIQAVLAKYGALNISIEHEDEAPTAINFQFPINKKLFWFRLEPDIDGVEKVLIEARDVEPDYKNWEQACRTAWKNKLEWIQAQLTQVSTNQAKLGKLLLGYGISSNGETIYRRLCRDHSLFKSPRS